SGAAWRLAGRLGNFSGFDGHFDRTPLLLDAGAQGSRHRFWVRSAHVAYRLDADVFGWVCRPDPSVDFPVRLCKGKRQPPLPAGANSSVAADDLVAFSLPDSFRIRVLTPPRSPL